MPPNRRHGWPRGCSSDFCRPRPKFGLLDNVTALSAAGSRFAADYGSVRGQTEETQRQAQIMTDRWRAHGLDLHIPDLTYPGEHTDVAAHLRAHGWDTARYRCSPTCSTTAGLAPLEADAQARRGRLDQLRPGDPAVTAAAQECLANHSACIASNPIAGNCGVPGSSSR